MTLPTPRELRTHVEGRTRYFNEVCASNNRLVMWCLILFCKHMDSLLDTTDTVCTSVSIPIDTAPNADTVASMRQVSLELRKRGWVHTGVWIGKDTVRAVYNVHMSVEWPNHHKENHE